MEHVTLFDLRDRGDAWHTAFAPHLEELGLTANLLSPVATLTPRTPWLEGTARLSFLHTFNGGWGIDTEYDTADFYAPQSVYPAYTLQVVFHGLASGLYLIAFALTAGYASGSVPEYWIDPAQGIFQRAALVPFQEQYIGTLIPVGEPGNATVTVTLKTFDIAHFTFRRAGLINVFG